MANGHYSFADQNLSYMLKIILTISKSHIGFKIDLYESLGSTKTRPRWLEWNEAILACELHTWRSR
jgi:hypothetical protein